MSWFDLQVNGYAGVDFNQDGLSAQDLHRACALLRDHGVRGILATIITAHPDQMEARLRRLAALRAADPLARSIIRGFHVEGPFLSPRDGFRGAHLLEAIRPATPALAERLLQAGDGLVRLFTLAPEHDAKCEVTRLLATAGVTVSAGHTDADLRTLNKAIEAGLSMFTHLGNGCPAVMSRHDNIVQRVLSLREHLWLCFIADGIHVPFFALRNYLDLIGPEGKVIVTTDAMSAAGLGPGRYRLGQWDVAVGFDLAARSPDGSHLLGSAVPMPRAVENLRRELGCDVAAVSRLADVNARRALCLLGSADVANPAGLAV